MTSLAIIKLVSDALLFGSLLLLSFRVLRKQPGSSTNFVKLKELELSLKEVVKQADEASQSFNEELITRRRDLEKVLANSQAVEGQISKTADSLDVSIKEAELAKRDLELAVNKSIEEFNLLKKKLGQEAEVERSRYLQQEQQLAKASSHALRETIAKDIYEEVPVADYQPVPQSVRSQPKPQSTLKIQESTSEPAEAAGFEYSKMLEPPSFSQISAVTEKRLGEKSIQAMALSQMIEKSTQPAAAKNRPLQDSLRSVAASAEKSIEASRLPDHLEEALASSVHSQNRISADPRLGVLAGSRRTTQIV